MKITTTKRKTRCDAPDGYRPVTTPFALPGEQAMLDGVIADMKRGGIEFVLVEKGPGIELWRRIPRAG